MRASITGRMSDGVVQGLRALGVRIQFMRFDPESGLPVHQLSTGGAYEIEQQQSRRALADCRALGAGGSGAGGRWRSDAGVDRPHDGRDCMGQPRVWLGVATAGQGSSDGQHPQ